VDRLLTQTETAALLAIEKRCLHVGNLSFPLAGEKLVLNIESLDGREKFLLDVNRGRIKLTQCTYQERIRTSITLVRLDLNGPEHTNPDGEVIPCPHLHIYREGYGDKWAETLPPGFLSPNNLIATLEHFWSFCNITDVPPIQGVIE
jgi:hypothetical protein